MQSLVDLAARPVAPPLSRVRNLPPWRVRLASSLPFAGMLILPLLGLLDLGNPGTASAESPTCATIEKAIRSAAASARLDLARQGIALRCTPLAPALWSAIEKGTWTDGAKLDPRARAALLSSAVGARYAEAESLGVTLLSTGAWPDGEELDLEIGADVIRGMKPALNHYRVLLLLDIYEQLQEEPVRIAVVETLVGAKEKEAWLPALDAHVRGEGLLRVAAEKALALQKDVDALLADLIATLPDDAALAWAITLANEDGGSKSKAAAAARKK